MREIRVDHVSKSFGKAKALDDVSLSFEHGKIHALLGRNGAGKSTLLGLIGTAWFPRAAASSWTASPPPTTREPWPSCTA